MTATTYQPGYVIAGKYELEEMLGQGGMGAVWRARNVALDALVAIKVLRATGDRAALRERLVQEARAAAKLTHPAIVKVFDVGQTDSGDPFIVMELLHGSSLGTILATESRVSAIQAARLLLPIADALSLAHSKGIVHRDLKPDNVFVVQDGGTVQPKLVDFGIVKMEEGGRESHLTQAGQVLGSPDYMSPEQARGQDDINLTTDVWSFSVVLYEAITGRTPFNGANYNALLRQIVEETPPSPQQLAAADATLSAMVMRGLHKRREERFQSMGELGRALASWLISQGVYEDICGTTLEARWLRGTDPHARPVGRASLVSITEGWPVEGGSGVRAQLLEPVHTLPAPPLSSPPLLEPAISSLPPAKSPRRVLMIAASIAMAAFLLGWLAVSSLQRDSAPVTPGSSARDEPTPSTAVVVQPEAPANEAAAEPVAPLPAKSADDSPSPESTHHKSGAQERARKVSSPAGRAPGAKRVVRPAPKPPATRTPNGKPSGKPSDLLRPYQ